MASRTRRNIIKMHRRTRYLDGRRHTVLTLRPGETVRYATNLYHETWHVLSGVAGGRLLGRLCWALAYQRRPGTLVLIDRPHLCPTPFDADPSSPILVVNRDLGSPSRAALRDLKRHLPLSTPSEGTAKLTTFGLERFGDNGDLTQHDRRQGTYLTSFDEPCSVDEVGGFIVMSGLPVALRHWGLGMAGLGGPWMWHGMDYVGLEWTGRTGEVQVFQQFHRMVSAARIARDRLFPDRGHERLLPEERDALYRWRSERERLRS